MADFTYDVYLSFSADSSSWVHRELLPRLHAHQLLVCAGEQDFLPGTVRVLEIEQAIQASRYTFRACWCSIIVRMRRCWSSGDRHMVATAC